MNADSEYKEFLEQLQQERHADRWDVSEAFREAKEILGKELRDLADVQERRRRSPWVHGLALDAPHKRTQEALAALAPERRKLVDAIMQELRDTNWQASPDPMDFMRRLTRDP